MSPTLMRGSIEPLWTTKGRQPKRIGTSVMSRHPPTNHSQVRPTMPPTKTAVLERRTGRVRCWWQALATLMVSPPLACGFGAVRPGAFAAWTTTDGSASVTGWASDLGGKVTGAPLAPRRRAHRLGVTP